MRIRLLKETDGEHTFYKVQRWSFWFGWCLVGSVDAVTYSREKAESLFNWLKKGNSKVEEVLNETTI